MKFIKLFEEFVLEKYVLSDLEDMLGITLDLWETKDHLELGKIEVPKSARGTGIGTKAMEEICTYADKVGKKIYLTPTKDFGATSISRLEEFYKEFGFVKKPKNDFSVKHTMVRFPEVTESTITEGKPAGAPDWHDSDAPDAEGRFKELGIKDLAAWLIKTRKGDLKRITGSLNQQIVFNRNDDPEYAAKMEKVRKEVYRQLDREDLLDEAQRDWNDKRRGPDPYKSGLTDKEEAEKEAQMKKQAQMSDDNPEAYKEMPGDKEAREEGRVKTSKHVKRYHELYGDEKNESIVTEEKAEGDRSPLDNEDIETALKKKSEETGVPIEFLRIVMRRGLAAWKTGHRPGAGQEQWGYARVNSFLTKQPGTWGGADKDVAKEVRDGGHDKKLKS